MQNEKILVIPSKVYTENPEKFLNNFTTELNNTGFYMTRHLAEVDENYLQIIPYCIIFKPIHYHSTFSGEKDINVFCYQRLKGGTEDRLHNKYSIGIGGHIEEDRDSRKSNTEALFSGAMAEINEELEGEFYPAKILTQKNRNNFLIYDPSNEVGRVHLGVMMFSYARSVSDVTVKEKNKISGEMIPFSRIKKSRDMALENWSKIAIENTCFTNIT